MTKDPRNSNQPLTIQDLEKFKPVDERDSMERAIFFATAMAVLSGNILTTYISYCQSAVIFDANGQFKQVQAVAISEDNFKRAAKEVQTLSLWLTIGESCGAEIPDWFREFTYQALRASDELIETPMTREIFETYPLEAGVVPTVQTLSLTLCHRLSLGQTRVDAALALGDMIFEADRQRIELLKFSLSQPLLVLDAWVAEVKPGAFQLQY